MHLRPSRSSRVSLTPDGSGRIPAGLVTREQLVQPAHRLPDLGPGAGTGEGAQVALGELRQVPRSGQTARTRGLIDPCQQTVVEGNEHFCHARQYIRISRAGQNPNPPSAISFRTLARVPRLARVEVWRRSRPPVKGRPAF